MASDGEFSAVDPWDVGQVTEKLPAVELYEDGVEPEDDSLNEEERAA